MRLIAILAAGVLICSSFACSNNSQVGDTGEDTSRTAGQATYPHDQGSIYSDRLRSGKGAEGEIAKPKQMPSEIKSDPKSPVVPEKTQ